MPVQLAYGPSIIYKHFYSEAEINFTGKGSAQDQRWSRTQSGYVGVAHSLLWYVSKHPIATPVV